MLPPLKMASGCTGSLKGILYENKKNRHPRQVTVLFYFISSSVSRRISGAIR